MTPQIHKFDSTGEAYDLSQTDDNISDGDVLVVESEKVVGVMVEAWPIAVGETSGEFHTLDYRCDWDKIPTTASHWTETKDYTQSYHVALDALNELLQDVAQKAWDEDVQRISESYKRDTK